MTRVSPSKRAHDAAALTSVLATYAAKASFSFESVARDALEMMKTARGLQRLGVEQCNRELTEREKKRERMLEENMKLCAARYGATVRTDGDPRGHVVKLKFKNGERYNDFGGEGVWCL